MTYESNKAHRPADHHPWRNSGLAKPTKVETERTCSKCGETKPIERFHRGNLGTRRADCDTCRTAAQRRYRGGSEKEKQREREKRAEPERRIRYNKARAKWRLKNRIASGTALPEVPKRWWGIVRTMIELDASDYKVRKLFREGTIPAAYASCATGGKEWRANPADVLEYKKKIRGEA